VKLLSPFQRMPLYTSLICSPFTTNSHLLRSSRHFSLNNPGIASPKSYNTFAPNCKFNFSLRCASSVAVRREFIMRYLQKERTMDKSCLCVARNRTKISTAQLTVTRPAFVLEPPGSNLGGDIDCFS
jgi:hypothetical protein